MKKIVFRFLIVLFLCAFGTSANALVFVDDWTINLNPVGITGTYTDISEIFYHGIAWNQYEDDGNYIVEAGEFGKTDGLLQSLTYKTTGGSTESFGANIGGTAVGVELTFDFSVNVQGLGVTGPVSNWTHLAAGTVIPNASYQTDGLLDIYVDAAVDANTTSGAGMTGGTSIWIATFAVTAGPGGDWNILTLDGHDDATFTLINSVAGVLLDSSGNDLTLGTTMAMTDSNFDGDPDVDELLNGYNGAGIGSAVGWTSGDTYTNFTAFEDGSAALGVVPEPTTMVLLGAGLLGLAGITRRKNS